MPSARRVHFLPKLIRLLHFEVGGVHSISRKRIGFRSTAPTH